MCGRYAAAASTDDLVEELEIEADHTGEHARSVLKNPQQPPAGEPDYNMAPTKNARVVLTRAPRASTSEGPEGSVPGAPKGGVDEDHDDRPVRQLRLLTWGLVPSWSRSADGGARMANARAETVLTTRAYQKAARVRRCLVPTTGWYEWQVSPRATDTRGRPGKQPFFVRRVDGTSAVMAGLYEFWRDREKDGADPDAWLATFTIVTTSAEPGLARLHDRQPVVLDREDWAAWLDPQLQDPDRIADVLRSARPGRFEAYPVGRDVGHSRANGPHLLEPVGPAELRGVVDLVTGEILDGDHGSRPDQETDQEDAGRDDAR